MILDYKKYNTREKIAAHYGVCWSTLRDRIAMEEDAKGVKYAELDTLRQRGRGRGVRFVTPSQVKIIFDLLNE